MKKRRGPGRGFSAKTIGRHFVTFLSGLLLSNGLSASAAVLSEVTGSTNQIEVLREVNVFDAQQRKTKQTPKNLHKEGELLVKFKPSASTDRKNKLHRKHGSEKINEIPALRVHQLKLKKGLAVAEAVKLYKEDPDVEYAEPNYIVSISETIPNDPYYSDPFTGTGTWGQPYHDLWGLKMIQAGGAWGYTPLAGSTPVIVAVLDTGIDNSHPDIQDNIVAGWNFISKDNFPDDDHGHGTHVSGTIAAASNNGIGIPGISWNAKIMPVKFLGANGTGTTADGAASIIYAADNGAKVINCSWGGSAPSQVLEDAIRHAFFVKGAVVVAAAGNNGIPASLFYPAGGEDVITVAATDYRDEKYQLTNYGPAVEVSAPGVDILSLQAKDTDMYPDGSHAVDRENRYIRADGTSMAAPHVSGLAALLFAQGWSAKQVVGRIIGTTDDIGDPTIGTGRINASSALNSETPSTVLIRYIGSLIDDSSPGNSDGQIDPGETIKLSVIIKNISASSSGVWANLSTTDPYVTGIVNDTAFFGDLDPWSSNDNTASPYLVTVASDAPKLHKILFTLTISANDGAYEVTESFEKRVSLDLPGWPVPTGASTANHPALADIDNTDRKNAPEVIIASDQICVIQGDGAFAAGWPRALPDDFNGWNSLAVGDLDEDGQLEIVAAGDGRISAWRADGTPRAFTVTPGAANAFFTQLSLSDLDGDGDLEIISISHNLGKVYAWHDDGTAVAGWPVQIAKSTSWYISMHASAGDIDGDGTMEVIAPTMGNKVHAFNHNGTVVSGWPKSVAYPIYSALADSNQDGKDEVFIGTLNSQLYAMNGNGTSLTGWTQPKTGAAPVIGDIDGDGALEIATNTGYSTVAVYRCDGTVLPGWPQNVGAQSLAPVLGDIDGDGRVEVLARDYSNHLYAWHADGTTVPEFPITIGSDIFMDPFLVTSLALGDINGDGIIDLVSGSGTMDRNIYAYTLPGTYTARDVPWPMNRHDSRRSANLNNPAIVTASLPGGAVGNSYDQTLSAKGGASPYTWSVVSGAFPTGLQMNSQTGEVTGTPTAGGIFTFVVQIVDAAEIRAAKAFSVTITGSVPDMIISALTVPASAGSGVSISITDTAKNNGQAGAAAASTTRYYLSTNTTLDGSDLRLGGRGPIPALAAGGENTATTAVIIPAGTPWRSYYLIAKADDGNDVPELVETNNTLSRSIAISGPDLAVSTLTVATAAGAGPGVSITDTTKNSGVGNAGASTTKFYLSYDTTLESTDTPLGDGRSVPSIAAGASSSGTTTATIPDRASDVYYIIAKADADNSVLEVSESNNTRCSALIGPDLTIAALSLPSAAGAGATITITDTTKNIGVGDTRAKTTTTSFYLSSGPSLEFPKVFLGSRTVDGLAGGASGPGGTTVTIPADKTSGTFYVIAKSDNNDAVSELREDNNILYKSIAIGTDLTVSALTGVPSSSGAGKTITVNNTTKNNGPAAVSASTTHFYLSRNTTLDGTASLIGSRSVPALAANASSQALTSVTIPADTLAQTYYIIAKADGDNLIIETSESNNPRTSSAIKIGPDLIVSALTATYSQAVRRVTITDTTKNSGGGDAGPSGTKFYLSSDTTLDVVNDTSLGAGRSVPALAAGASSLGTTTATIPAGTTGIYFIIAESDGNKQVGEMLETNNTKYSNQITIN